MQARRASPQAKSGVGGRLSDHVVGQPDPLAKGDPTPCVLPANLDMLIDDARDEAAAPVSGPAESGAPGSPSPGSGGW